MRLGGLVFPILALAVLRAEGPLDAPPGVTAFARSVMDQPSTVRGKLEALLHAVFDPVEQGGLGMVYDQGRTRTVQEAWVEHRANCLTLTAFYVAACRSMGLEARFAEVLNVNRWHRAGSIIRFERHIVAIVKASPMEDLVADFMPKPRRRSGSYLVAVLVPERVLALFHSNRAVELLESPGPEAALGEARRSLEVDPGSGIGWNIQGVVLDRLGRHDEAEVSFRKALELDAKDGTALGNLEHLLREAGRLDEAAYCRDRGHAIRKKDPYFLSSLAEEALDDGQWKDALKYAKASVKLQPQDPELLLVLARAYLALGDSKASLAALEKAKKLALPEEQARFESKMAIIRKGELGK